MGITVNSHEMFNPVFNSSVHEIVPHLLTVHKRLFIFA